MNRLYCLLLVALLASTQGFSQARRKNVKGGGATIAARKTGNSFLDKQWWLGFKAGTNLTKANEDQSYTVLVPVNYEASSKKYEDFNKLGSQAAIEVTFYMKGFSFSLQPTYFHSRFVYKNAYEWIDPAVATNRLVLNYTQEQVMDRAEIPLLVKYDIAGNKLRPFVQGGVFYSMLLSASKSVEVKGIDYASGGVNEYSDEPVQVGAEDLFAKNYWGLQAGAGLNYNLGNVRFTFDATYRFGMSLANSTENRYKSDRLSGIGDSLDDIKLNNMVFSLGCLFPMRYLASGFKTLDR
jgi:hypothetical protein